MKNIIPPFVLALAVSGCSSIDHQLDLNEISVSGATPASSNSSGSSGDRGTVYYLGAGTAYNYSRNCVNSSTQKCFRTAYEEQSTDATKQKSVRNRIVYELMGIVDDDFTRFQREFRKDLVAKDLGVKVVSLLLTAGASVASEGAAQTLAAIDTGLKGVNETLDTTAYRNYSSEFLISKMRADRAAVATRIYFSLEQAVDIYPLEAALRDIVEYYSQGTVTSALTSLVNSTAKEAGINESAAASAGPRGEPGKKAAAAAAAAAPVLSAPNPAVVVPSGSAR